MNPEAKAQVRRYAMDALDGALLELQQCLSASWDVRLELARAQTPDARAIAMERFDACRAKVVAAHEALVGARALVNAVLSDLSS